MRYIPILLAIIAALTTAGCGSTDSAGPQRYSLTGMVTYQGAPLPAGKIFFEPDSSQGNSGPMTMAEIKDGKYETPKGKGPVGGPHRIRIEGFDGNVTDEHYPQGATIFSNYLLEEDLPKSDSNVDFIVEKKK
ncbi:hypothetical protein M4951_22605 [Blastopirellula sp. J2-11]|uniref:hypothetical protein n=1 Tax=Blastopirellula sp. J2-11 TaxID=2943192 RepID=UPI0021C56C4C|nr:hypothetical protein [Blastopirellula sp. J2-11]UUO06139.1 hypothetical protein M4951_22605 [Blastopirellula sp. J2-11]